MSWGLAVTLAVSRRDAEPNPAARPHLTFPAISYLHTAEVADILHVSPKTLSRWAKEGRLPYLKTFVATGAIRPRRSASWPTNYRCGRRPKVTPAVPAGRPPEMGRTPCGQNPQSTAGVLAAAS